MFTITTVAHKTSDSRHPLIMLTNREGYKYFFGKIPEGSQRILNENRFKLGKLKSIFLTGTLSSWSEIGGLPGLFLTISDSTKKSIEVFMNSGKLASFAVATWRYFVFRKGVELKLRDAEEHILIADSNLTIRPIKIMSNVPRKISPMAEKLEVQLKKLVSLMFPMDVKANDPDPSSYKSDPSETEVHTHVDLPHPSDLIPNNQQDSVSYLIRFLPIRGKFDPIKAKELGIKPGIDFRKLTQGHPVTNENNETVQPHQVIEKSKHFSKLLILDIPNNTYLYNSIQSNKWFEKSEDMGQEEIGLVYHLLGDDIDYQLQEYVNFMKKFHPDCKHVISHSKLADDILVFKTSTINLLKLRCLQEDAFNLPYIEECKSREISKSIFRLHQLQQFHIESSGVQVDDSLVENNNWSDLYDSNIANLDLPNVDKDKIIHSAPIPLNFENLSLKDQVQVVTLGTGSALPSIHRNVISNLIRIPSRKNNKLEFRSILLDGGENTFGSMLRNFGHNNQSQLTQIFEELCLIHLSHLHADHHLGLISVINHWFKVNRDNDKVLYLIIPWQYNKFINEWYQLEKQSTEFIDLDRIIYLSCEEFIKERQPEFQQLDIDEFERRFDQSNIHSVIPRKQLDPKNTKAIRMMYQDLNINAIETVRAIHCYWSYSISLDFKLDEGDKFKVSYSGDTRPNPKFVEIGSGSDLLIHESSLDNELIEEAIAKKHTTMVEAITCARLMKCRKLILTHFSTRYSNKANMVFDGDKLSQLSESLKDYMIRYGSIPNIFMYEDRIQDANTTKFEDLEICFAFDMMNIRLNNIADQRKRYKEILELFLTDETEEDDLKRDKELQKQREKRELKRIQRLSIKNSKKKRKVSSDEED